MAVRSPQLEAAFRATRYELTTPFLATTLRVDEASAALGTLQALAGASESGLVGAWNPRSERRSAQQNEAAHARLAARVAASGLKAWPAWARAPQPEWDEQCLYIAGIGLDALLALGREFDQHAVLHAGPEACPRLAWCFG
jgi:hypothetical protein